MATQSNQPLPDGFQLKNYTIEKLLSSGGFSIVYLARDEHGAAVAIKEYLPSALVMRTSGAIVEVASEEHQAVFRHGLKCFFEEGRALATIAHPNIVRVENFFRANETVYMVMQYVRGRTLHFHIQRHRDEFTESFFRRIFTLLLNGLREVHAKKLLHLDIKPSNVYVTMEGKPVLLDFGAARQTLTSDAPKLRPMYTAGYAAPEQYGDQALHGPWTDIYAVGATMYTCLTGLAPQAAPDRVKADALVPTRQLTPAIFSDELTTIVDWCLKVDHLTRPQTAFELQKALRKEVTESPSEPAPVAVSNEDYFSSMTDRLKATLNRKIF